MRIEVKNAVAVPRNITIKATGEIRQFVEQEAYAYTSDKFGNPHAYPTRITIDAQPNGQPYPVGFYTIADPSYYVDKYGKLALGRMSLVPMAAAASAPARSAAA